MTEVVQLDHLTKRFGKFQALTNVTFTIHPGEVFGFIGPNGAGKSTTIRILLGQLRATSGHASIFGQPAWSNAVSRLLAPNPKPGLGLPHLRGLFPVPGATS